ncbi:hypothetical protein TanjilG_30504 [Lupinus angustifolius]|uniref:Protein kinase domain-containing protein n=1 Tax=Lupinus angustifolius TaxID=3871 RepID=A0A394DMZ0_LUPAN|nr:PREDICTED: probable leucine-rich repeat receptor-like protein kinase At1g68400 [Lupinus angustifolius]XP_019432479.1 PREDICTED: probable leucine-rich repeat receptor-like protein kinase At1g68400 [Lupinus angustifolius]OIW21181.1 hypothetical protein TanjilG_30504 [Lupinus angustifolius]
MATPPPPPPPSLPLLHLTIFTFFFFHHLLLTQATQTPDLHPLLSFKTTSDTHNKLTTWNSTTHPCTWSGISCLNNRVSRLVLQNLNLTGSILPLTSLTQLRLLSLKRNRFNGTIPSLSNLTSLKLLYLSHNNFSGQFPSSITSLSRLYRLDLSYNNFSGRIPVTVNNLTHLLTLKIDGNRMSGHIPDIKLPSLRDFNVSGNRFSGRIPVSLSGFNGSAFERNKDLCGAPLQKCKDIATLISPLNPRNITSAPTVPSSPSSKPLPGNPTRKHGAPKMSPVVLIAIIIGDVLVLAVVSLLLYCYFWRNYSIRESMSNSDSKVLEKIAYYSSSSAYPNGYGKGGMVFFEGAKRFEVEELLRASAEMLGKGGFGTCYKAVLEDGSVVAVKRLKEVNIGGKKEFEQQMEVIGKLRHPNVVSLKAYYFAKDEKLLVSDYISNGSLFWLLHGNRGPGRTPLDWTTRLKIATGAAQGVAFIHKSNNKLTHGNIKSTNILVDVAGNAQVADFGLSIFTTRSNERKSNGYRAAEASSDGRKQTQKSDVYSFGVLLMEILTGKCPAMDGGDYVGASVDLPRWVQSVVREEWTAEVFDLELMRYKDIEEEMVALLKIAMECTVAAPDQRPTMCHVAKMIEELHGSNASTLDSVSESPSVCET